MPTHSPTLTRGAFVASLAGAVLAGPTVACASGESYAAIVERYRAAGTFDGVVLIAHGPRILYRGAAGVADRVRGEPHAASETFRIASVTKQFTALLAMQDVERGVLELDEPVSTYLPNLPRAVGVITTRQLLKSISGLPNLDAIPSAYTRTDVALDDLPAYVATLPLTPLDAQPGTAFSYNNLDFLIAGAVIERLGGKPFGILLRERIIDKLALRSTGLYGAQPRADVAGYELDGGRLIPERIGRLANFGPAGAMYSTVDDLLRWDRALLGRTLLGSSATAEMFRGDPAFGHVALGSWAYDITVPSSPQPVALVERQGNIGGIAVLNVIAPKDDLALILMANTDRANLFNLYTHAGLPYELLALAVNDARTSA